MWSIYFLLFLSVAVHGRTDEELKAEMTKIILGCVPEHPVPADELMKLQALTVPTDKDTKCLMACAYKKEGTMNDKGMFDLDHAYKLSEKEDNGDAKRRENGKKFADVCVKVNDLPVSDGEKGCDRAALIFKCVVENAHKFGFKV